MVSLRLSREELSMDMSHDVMTCFIIERRGSHVILGQILELAFREFGNDLYHCVRIDAS